MQMQLKHFRVQYLDSLLDFLWREWTALGVAGHDRRTLQHVADPEALLLLTCSLGRYDPRLFDEVMDWLLKNGRYINVQRLRTILRNEGFRGAPVLVAVADWLTRQSNPAKWKLLANLTIDAEVYSHQSSGGRETPSSRVGETDTHQDFRVREEPDAAPEYRTFGNADATPLFHLPDGRPLPVLKEKDDTFLCHGLVRAPLQPRGLSAPFPTDGTAARLIRLRALFGVSVRCDVLNYLALNGTGHPREVARELYFAQKSVYDVLTDLERFGAVVSARGARERVYRLTPEGSRLVENGPTAPGWINWPVLFAAAESVWYLVEALTASAVLPEEAATLTQQAKAPIAARFTRARWAPPLPILGDGDAVESVEAFRQYFEAVVQ